MTASAPDTYARRRPPVVSFTVFELRRVLRTASFLIWTLAFPVVFYLVSYHNPTNNAGNTRSWGCPGRCTSWSRWPRGRRYPRPSTPAGPARPLG